MGSFLSMQAYFGATFVDGIGPVTGVGLIRNLAPLLTGFVLAGLASARFVAELGLERCRSDSAGSERSRRVAARLVAATLAGPILSIWASLIGVAVGWLVAHQMMGISPPAFFDMFLEMLWVRDVVGLVVKGAAFGFFSALFACQEGAGRSVEDDPAAELESISWSATRGVCLAALAILVINGAWFLLVYHAGAPFGPTVLTPPSG
jgi:phospholipid/cholesterol/gamma-HCH transport system permease protein